MEGNSQKRPGINFVTVIIWSLLVILVVMAASLSYAVVQDYEQVTSRYGLNNFEYRRDQKSMVYSSDGMLIAELYEKNKDYVPLADISQPMKEAIIAIEDHRYYNHMGIDFIGILRALYIDLSQGEVVEGGSTITQQLVRNLFLSNEKTFKRKITESFLAFKAERKYRKAEILEMYLNEIYFGNGCYGVEAAAMKYFKKHAKDLDLTESTVLAAIPKSPNLYEPVSHLSSNKSRQKDILNRMVDLKMVTREEANSALQREVKVQPPDEESQQYRFPFFTTEVIKQLVEQYGRQRVFNDGLVITTTLDSRAVQAAEDVVKRKAAELKGKGIAATNICIVSVNPVDGAVLSLVGGTDFAKDQNNLALIPRQPGSSIKPIHYAGAIEKGLINENSMINAKSKEFNKYFVSSKMDGSVTVMSALKHSINVPAVEVVNMLGVKNALENLKKFGITTISENDCNLAIALGGMYYGIKPVEMAAAFATFANQGKYNKPFMIKTVKDHQGTVLFQHEARPEQIISPRTAQIISKILIEAVRGGTGRRANISGNEAGKTGTTDDSRCLWFVGYTNEISTAVWVGNSNNRPVYGYTGGDLASPIWREYMVTLINSQVIKKIPKNNRPLLPEHIEKATKKPDPEPATPAAGNPQVLEIPKEVPIKDPKEVRNPNREESPSPENNAPAEKPKTSP